MWSHGEDGMDTLNQTVKWGGGGCVGAASRHQRRISSQSGAPIRAPRLDDLVSRAEGIPVSLIHPSTALLMGSGAGLQV